MPLSDAEILEQFGREKTRNAAFAHLVEKYQQKIYWHVRRMVVSHDDADDLVQEIFINVWNNLDRFRQDAQLYSWMYRIASNECLQFLQKKKRQNTTSFDELTENTADSFGTSDGFSGDQIQQKLYRAIETLPEKQKLIFQMKYFEEMKYEEISSVLGTSVGALKASFHLAVKKIEQQLVQHD